jgi:hypothetical protein
MRRVVFIFVLLMILISCTGNQEADCVGFDPTLTIISGNPCLRDAKVSIENDVHQMVPDQYNLFSIPTIRMEDGSIVTDDYSAHALISCGEDGCLVDVHNGLMGINGIWGYTQTIEYQGCALLKLTTNERINDPIWGQAKNYSVNFYIDGELAWFGQAVRQGVHEYAFATLLSGTHEVSMTYQIAFATPGEGSELYLYSWGVYSVDNSWCQ